MLLELFWSMMRPQVQYGLGRTGHMWVHESYGVLPDIMTLAKPLAGGLPVSTVLNHLKGLAALTFRDHGSTFACSMVGVSRKGQLLKEETLIHKLSGNPHVKEVCGIGLIVRIELDFPASALVDACRNAGLLILTAGQGDVVRLVPPLIVSEDELEQCLEILVRCMPSLDGIVA